MTSRDRFRLALSHQEPDRVPVCDTTWPTTVERWHREGLPADASPFDYFGYEWVGMGADISFQLPEQTIEETEEYRIVKDSFGATTRVFKGRESVPELIAFPVTSLERWEEHRPLLAWNDTRVDWEGGLAHNRAMRDRGYFVTSHTGFGYDRIQRFCGAPLTLMAMHDNPAWVLDMMETIADTVITSVAEMIAHGFEFDGAFIWNDIGYKNGPFFSPEAYLRFEFPSQKRMCDFFHSHDMPVILHTDGDIRKLIPHLIEAGIDCLQPIESKAGMDLVELKADWGDRMAFMGGINVMAMADPDPRVIEREVSTKLPAAKRGGGYIYHSDHSVPDNVSFAQYRGVRERGGEYGGY
jgi:uroporphyrinogen decarboxylase